MNIFSHAFVVFTFFFFRHFAWGTKICSTCILRNVNFSAVLNLTEKRRNIVCNPIYLFMYLFTITFKFVFGVGVGEGGREHEWGRR